MRLMPFNFDRLESGSYFLSNMAGFHCFLEEQLLCELVDHSQTSLSSIDEKLESGLFIAPEYVEDASIAALASGLAKKLQTESIFRPIFMIVPTLRCDHTCSYCQVSRAPLNSSKHDLIEEKIPVIINTIRKLGTPPYKLEIQGGEPLVRFDLVQKLYDEAAAQLGSGNFEFVVATSLSLFDETILSWAKSRDVNFSTSLDGNDFVHNSSRILYGDDSYQKVKNAINMIQDQLGAGKVATVTTVTRALLSRPETLIDAHLEMGLHDLFIRPISPYGFANSKLSDAYSMQEYMVFYRRLFDIILASEQASTLVEHSAAIHMKRIMNPGFSGYADLKSPSGFLLNSMLFNYDGKVYGSDEARMLQRVLGELDFSCGEAASINLSDNQLYNTILNSSFNILHPGCEHCAYQPYCGSDPCQHIASQGEPLGDKSLSLFCQYHKEMFRFLLNQFNTSPDSRDLLMRWCHE